MFVPLIQHRLTKSHTTEITSRLSPEQKAALGIDTPLPTSLPESLEALERAIEEKRLFPLGEGFLRGYLAHKRAEYAHFKDKPESDNRKLFISIW
jgi:glutamine synthetase